MTALNGVEGNYTDSRPQITAVGTDGAYVVTWSGNSADNGSQIYVQRFDADGKAAGGVTALNGETGNFNPQITAVGTDGAFVVTWQGNSADNSTQIYVQRFDADGKAAAGGVTALNGETGDFTDNNPQITALGTDGAYMVTWYGSSADNGSQIYLQRFNADGNVDGEVVALNGVEGKFLDSAPQITAVGTDGAYVVTWYGSSADNSTLIYVQRFNPDGSMPDKSLLNDPANDVVDVQSSEPGTAYLVDASATVKSVAQIEALNDSQWNSVAVTAANTTTSIAASGLADGTYYVYVADAAGNLGQVADVITIDTTPPVAPEFALSNDTGSSDSDSVTSDTTINVTVADDATSWQYSLDGGKTWTTGSGDSFELSANAVYAIDDIQVRQFDKAGNQSVVTSNDIAITTDSTAAAVTLAATVTNAINQLNFQAAETGTAYLVSANATITDMASLTDASLASVSITASNTNTAFANTTLDDGGYQIYFVDTAGNMSKASSTITLDTTAPTGKALLDSVVTVDGEATNYDYAPQITAVGTDGAYVVTWYGESYSGTGYQIYVQRFNAAGSPDGNVVALAGVAGDFIDFTPQITAVGTDGAYVVTWYSDSDDNNYQIYVQRFNADGSAAGGVVALNGVAGDVFDAEPQITSVGTDGAFVVTWQGESDNENGNQIYVQRFGADGSTNGDVTALNGVAGQYSDTNPQVTALGSEGAYVVTWQGESIFGYQIYVQRFDADGNARGDVVALNGDSEDRGYLDWDAQITALGNDGSFVAVWYGDSSNGYQIYVQLFNADGVDGHVIALDGAVGDLIGRKPQVATLDNQGAFAVVWYGKNAENADHVYVQRFNADGTKSSDLISLQSDSGSEPPQITAVGSDGAFVVTWQAASAENGSQIYVQLFNADGSVKGDVVALNGEVGDYRDLSPQVSAVGSNGSYVVVWHGTSSQYGGHIFIQLFNPDGSVADKSLLNDPANDVVDVQSSEPGTAYLVDASATVKSVAQIEALNDNQWNSVAISTANTTTSIAASGLADGTYYVYVADAAGNLGQVADVITIDTQVDAVTVADTLVNADESVTFQANETGTAYLVAADATNIDVHNVAGAAVAKVNVTTANTDTSFDTSSVADNDYQIYFVDDAGNISSASSTITLDTTAPTGSVISDTLVTLNGGASNNLNPQITAVGTEGAYVVTWYGDSAENGNQIYVQRFDAEGNAAGEVVALNGVTGIFADYHPQITAVGTNGDYVVTWYGASNNGNDNQIYVQRFNADGSVSGDVTALNGIAGSLYDFYPQITALGTDGAYVVTWYGASNNGSSDQIYVQRFDDDGVAAGGVVALNGETGSYIDTKPQITSLGTNGAYVVTWQGNSAEIGSQIYVQRFNANGSVNGGVTALNGEANYLYEYDPQITAVGTNGAFVVTWYSGSTENGNQIYVQRFNELGNAEGEVVALNGVMGDFYDTSPQITAVGTEGAYVVTWYGASNNGNSYQIYVQRFDADGKVAGGVVALNGETGNFYDYNPQITAVGTEGAYVVTWYGSSAENGYQIYLQRFDAEGNAEGEVVALNGVKGNFYDSFPQITAVGTDGAYVVTWYGPNASDDYQIYVQRFNPDGSPADKSLLNDPANDVVDVQSSEAGTAYLVDASVNVTSVAQIEALNDNQWNSVAITAANTTTSIAASGLADGKYTVYLADAAGNWSALTDVITIDTHVEAVTVADTLVVADEAVTFQANETGTAYLVAANATIADMASLTSAAVAKVNVSAANTDTSFDTSSVADNDYQIYFVDDAGNISSASSTVTLEATIPTGKVMLDSFVTLSGESLVNALPQITAVGSNGAYVVTWVGIDMTSNNQHVYAQRFNADGTADSDIVDVSGQLGGSNFPIPQVTSVGTEGDFVITWYADDSSDSTINVQRFNADATTSGELVTFHGEFYAASVQVSAVGTEGDYVVTWASDSGTNDKVYVQRFNADGTVDNDLVALDAVLVNGRFVMPQIAAVGADGAYVVTWSGDSSDDDSQIYVQSFDADGNAAGAVVELNGVAGLHTDYMPQIAAVGTDGAYVVTWYGSGDGNRTQIYVQRFGADGNADVGLVALNGVTGSYNDENPQITAVGTDGAFVVTWSGDSSDGDRQIYVQRFDALGNAEGEVVALHGVTGNFDDSYPQITAVGTGGDYVVTWQGESADNGEQIYVQRFNADGSPSGDRVALNGEAGYYDDASPQVSAVGTDGSYAVTWYGQNASGGYQIYVQHFNADGSMADKSLLNDPANDVVDVQSSEPGTAYLVDASATVKSVAQIEALSDNQWNSVAVTAANTTTSIAASGLADGTYYVYVADAVGNLGQLADVITIDTTPPVPTVSTQTVAEGDTITVTSSEVGTVYLVSADVSVSSLSDITSLDDDQYNQQAIDEANVSTAVGTDGLAGGEYVLYALDKAGNLSAASNNTVMVRDESVVLFDLTTGLSSDHSSQTFSADEAYTIYIKVDSDSYTVRFNTEERWSGAANLGSDDTIIFVGDGEPIEGLGWRLATQVWSRTASVVLGTRLRQFDSVAIGIHEDGRLYRYQSGVGEVVELWGNGDADFASMNFSFATALPAGVLTTQGLASDPNA
ncbi:hypothetical protein L9G15_01430 [Shewanella sp. A3A]|nr:hypothetical protein [Shewanella ferrihydritica]